MIFITLTLNNHGDYVYLNIKHDLYFLLVFFVNK